MRRGLFITAAGTGIGKTFVTSTLAWQLVRMGHVVRPLKPVVSGFRGDDPDSDPAVLLRSVGRAMTPGELDEIAPWRFKAALSPDRAARLEGRQIRFGEVVAFCRQALDLSDDNVLIEGAGGVMSPISEARTMLDLIIQVRVPTILVVGTYLGSLSHALTALRVLEGSHARIRAIVVSDSADGVGLAEAAATLRALAPPSIKIVALARLTGTENEKWEQAPDLTHLCESTEPRS